MLSITIGALANVPEKHFAFGAILQRDQSQIEKREQLLAMLERVVIVLAIILNCDCLAQVAQLNHYLRIVFVDFDRRDVLNDGFNLFQNVRYQNRMISG